MKHERIQRKRTKGWRKPEGAVIVDRTSRWGNPFKVGDRSVPDALTAKAKFRVWINGDSFGARYMRGKVKSELRGKDLVCWCALDQPCHADILLKLANEVQL